MIVPSDLLYKVNVNVFNVEVKIGVPAGACPRSALSRFLNMKAGGS